MLLVLQNIKLSNRIILNTLNAIKSSYFYIIDKISKKQQCSIILIKYNFRPLRQ